MTKIKSIITIILIAFSTNVFSQTHNFENLNKYLSYIENNNLGVGSVSIFEDNKEVYQKNFGQKNIQNLAFDNNTKYQVGSVTKMITAALIFKLIQNNQLKLEDKLSEFYPQIPNAKIITIKNLLEHTSGLGSYVVKNGVVWVTENVSEKEILDLIIQQGVLFQPNEQVKYSNSAYYLLTKILEKIHQQPFHKIFDAEIAKPLHLKNTASIKSNPKNIFKPYKFNNHEWTELKEEIYYPNVIGVGDIASTPKELNIIINSLFQHKIVKKETLELMMPVLDKEGWGRGLALWDFDGYIFFGHGGDTLGSHALIIYNKEKNLSIAYNTNGEILPKEEFVKNIVHSLYDEAFHLPEIK
ncbi:serine hydrolase [Chitinophaga sp. Cy-1792]|uniref:serine hydrolase domain-containing protein n=1 Tax=Chitinophaga sp. Cy-1792 TaxID=2608339 RepID=UPI001423DE63|nr:serine hydrolase domain-containing protein [Chitinophaga sp. Cy-1792]NIG52986.1 beta-lactamase family protein [Chitinophaga sp. Cy-1792]